MKLNNAKITTIYVLGFICFLLFLYILINITTSNNGNKPKYVSQYNTTTTWQKNNRWYGLNAGGDYRGYGREYGGHLSPRRIYNDVSRSNVH